MRADRGVDRVRTRQAPAPQILVLDVAEQLRGRLPGVEMLPSENGARVGQVEVDHVTLGREPALQRRVRIEGVLRREVMVEHDDLFGDLAELAQRVVREGDVDEYDLVAVVPLGVEVLLVAARDVARFVTPGAPEEADALHREEDSSSPGSPASRARSSTVASSRGRCRRASSRNPTPTTLTTRDQRIAAARSPS